MSPTEDVVSAALSAMDTLATLARQAAREWIPAMVKDSPVDEVRENVPSNGREVLVFLNGHVVIGDTLERNEGGWGIRMGRYDDGAWCVSGRREHHVTHWMELPAAPPIAAWPPVGP